MIRVPAVLMGRMIGVEINLHIADRVAFGCTLGIGVFVLAT